MFGKYHDSEEVFDVQILLMILMFVDRAGSGSGVGVRHQI